jgi:hypothetical protein
LERGAVHVEELRSLRPQGQRPSILQLVVFVTVLTSFYYCTTLFVIVAALVTKLDYQPLLRMPHFLAAMLIGTALLISSFRFAEQGTAPPQFPLSEFNHQYFFVVL